MESKQRRQCDPKHGTMNLYGNLCKQQGFPGGSMIKEFACQCRRHRFDPWVGKSPGKGNGYPLQDSCLGNPMDSRVWLGTVHGVAEELGMTEQLSIHANKTAIFWLVSQVSIVELGSRGDWDALGPGRDTFEWGSLSKWRVTELRPRNYLK